MTQKKLAFYEIFILNKLGYQNRNSLKTFCTDIKTIERVKKQTMFQRKIEDFKGK